MLPLITILCPVYNEEQVVPLFFARMHPVIKALREHYRVHLVFLNNASTDGTYGAIAKLRAEFDHIYVITLSRNVGYQRSLESGIRTTSGDLIAFIDVDCEDPPEMLLEFVKLHETGHDIVYGERVDREEGRVMKGARKLFYRIVRRVADDEIILYMAEFSLFTAEVREAIVADRNSFPFIRSSISRVGFNRIGIAYRRHRRIAGKTNYNLPRMVVFAVAGILSSSTLPLRIPIYVFPFWLCLTAILGIAQIETNSLWFGLLNLLMACAFFGGAVSFIALYVARTYKNALGRPNFHIHRKFTHLPTP